VGKFIPTTTSNQGLEVCENLLNREFQAVQEGEKWVSDITYRIIFSELGGTITALS
jgi:transposase InsO family protein